MPWFIRFCFWTAPVLVGVAVTLALPPTGGIPGLGVVLVIGLVWLVAAHQVKNGLKATQTRHWAILWFAILVVAPVVGSFVAVAIRDPGVAGVFQRRALNDERIGPGSFAPSAPARHILSWSEVGELFARVRPLMMRFAIQLLTSLPPVWWFIAFGIAIWRKK